MLAAACVKKEEEKEEECGLACGVGEMGFFYEAFVSDHADGPRSRPSLMA